MKLAKAANVKLKQMRAENTKLEQKLEDIRVIDRAKCILISYLGMTEKRPTAISRSGPWTCESPEKQWRKVS